MSSVKETEQKILRQARETFDKYNLNPFELNHIARDELASKCKIHSSTCESINKQLEGGIKRDDFLCFSGISNPEGFTSMPFMQTIETAIRANSYSPEPIVLDYEPALLKYTYTIDTLNAQNEIFNKIRAEGAKICMDVSPGDWFNSRIDSDDIAHNEMPKLMGIETERGITITTRKPLSLTSAVSAAIMPDIHFSNRDTIVLGNTYSQHDNISDHLDTLAIMSENKLSAIKRALWDYDGDSVIKQKPTYSPKGSKVLTHGVNVKRVAKNRKKKKGK